MKTIRDTIILAAFAFIFASLLFFGLDRQVEIEQAADVKQLKQGDTK